MAEPSKPLLVIGIDNATSTGVIVYEPTKDKILKQILVVANKEKEVPQQLAYLFDVVTKIVQLYSDTYDVRVFTEAPYLNIMNKNMIFITTFGRLKGIEGVIQAAAVKAGARVRSIAIRSHQAFSLKLLKQKAKGRKEIKKALQDGFSEMYKTDFQTNDVADALSIALFGASVIDKENA
jgi:Holliday junction resolvasome RuvABC endonuclease subunit